MSEKNLLITSKGVHIFDDSVNCLKSHEFRSENHKEETVNFLSSYKKSQIKSVQNDYDKLLSDSESFFAMHTKCDGSLPTNEQ